MAKHTTADLETTYRTLRRIIEHYASAFDVVKETPKAYYLASKTATTRSGAPVWFGGAQIMKNYVSFHLIPVYADPLLMQGLSPALRRRMQGKSCFNFRRLEESDVRELEALTRRGFDSFVRKFS